jgi:hypothetical protein
MKPILALFAFALLLAGCSNACTFGPAATPPVTPTPSTASKSWAPAVQVTSAPFGIDGLKLLVGPNDMLVAVWHQSATVNGAVQDQLVIANGNTSGTWGSPIVVLTGSNTRAALDAAIDARANMMLAWIENGAPPVVKAARVSPLTGVVGQVHQVGTAASFGGAGDLRLAMTLAGDAVAIWLGTPTNLPAILASRYAGATDSWDATSTRLNPATSAAKAPTIAIDGNANALASWIQATGGGVDALHQDCFNAASGKWGGYNVYSPTRDTTSTLPGPLPNTNAEFPNALFDSPGNALVIWSQEFAAVPGVNALGIMTQRYNRSLGQWEQPMRQDQPATTGVGGNFLPVLAASVNDGQAFGVWFYTPTLPMGAVHGIPYAGAFLNTQRIDTNATNTQVTSGPLKIGMAPDGEALAVWTQADGLYSRYRSFTGAWFSPVTKLGSSTDGLNTAVAMDSVSRGTVMWVDSNHTLWARRFQ